MLSRISWRIWWFHDSSKYRKIAPLVDPPALRSTLEADLRLALLPPTDSAELWSSAGDLNPGSNIHWTYSSTQRRLLGHVRVGPIEDV